MTHTFHTQISTELIMLITLRNLTFLKINFVVVGQHGAVVCILVILVVLQVVSRSRRRLRRTPFSSCSAAPPPNVQRPKTAENAASVTL